MNKSTTRLDRRQSREREEDGLEVFGPWAHCGRRRTCAAIEVLLARREAGRNGALSLAEALLLLIGVSACALGVGAFAAAWYYHGRHLHRLHVPVLITAGGLFCLAIGIPILGTVLRLLADR